MPKVIESRPDIAELRKGLGLSQTQAAEQAGVGQRVVANAERGHTPRKENRPKLAALYGKSTEELWPDTVESEA